MKAPIVTFLAALACVGAAQAEGCPRKGTLGTSRVLAVDAATYPRVGLQSFLAALGHRANGVLKDLATAHLDVL